MKSQPIAKFPLQTIFVDTSQHLEVLVTGPDPTIFAAVQT